MPLIQNYPVDRTDFRLIRGVQNDVLFFVRNLDRNPANTTYFQTLTINIIDPPSSTLLMSRNLTTVDAASALYGLTILASETADWNIGPLQYSVTVTRIDNATTMLWTDRNYGPFGMIDVTPGPVPGPTAPIILDPATFLLRNYAFYSPTLPGAAKLGYQNGLQTFAIYPANFTGTIEIDASLAAQPNTDGDWFEVSTTTYTAINALTTITAQGNYLWMRVVITQPQNMISSVNGSISQILYKN